MEIVDFLLFAIGAGFAAFYWRNVLFAFATVLAFCAGLMFGFVHLINYAVVWLDKLVEKKKP